MQPTASSAPERSSSTGTAPTLVAAGRYDELAPLRNAQALAGRIAGARLEVFEGGHIFLAQDPRAWPLIGEFLLSR